MEEREFFGNKLEGFWRFGHEYDKVGPLKCLTRILDAKQYVKVGTSWQKCLKVPLVAQLCSHKYISSS